MTAEGKAPNADTTGKRALASRIIDGSVEPEKISFGTRYRMLIANYHGRARPELANQLAPEDRAIMEQLVANTPAEHAAIGETLTQARLKLCANRAGKTPLQLAQEYDQIVGEFRARLEARYRKALDALSATGRNIVEYYVQTEVVQGLQVLQSPSSIEHAIADPDDFMEAVDIDCYVAEHGHLPANAQKALDETLKKFEERGRTNDNNEGGR